MYKENIVAITTDELKGIIFEYIKRKNIIKDRPVCDNIKEKIDDDGKLYAIEYKWSESYTDL